MTRKTIFDIYNEQHKEPLAQKTQTNEVVSTPTEEVSTETENISTPAKSVETKTETISTPLDDKGATSLQEGENENGNSNLST